MSSHVCVEVRWTRDYGMCDVYFESRRVFTLICFVDIAHFVVACCPGRGKPTCNNFTKEQSIKRIPDFDASFWSENGVSCSHERNKIGDSVLCVTPFDSNASPCHLMCVFCKQGDMQLKPPYSMRLKRLKKCNNISFEPKWILKVPTYSVCMNQSDYSNMGVLSQIYLNHFKATHVSKMI